MSSRIRPLLLGGVILAALGIAGCTAGAVDSDPTASVTRPAPSGEQTPTGEAALPTPSQTPDVDDPSQIALFLLNPDRREDYNESTAGPGVIEAGHGLRIDGWCEGGRVSYELMTAGVGDEKRSIAGGTFVCGDAIVSNEWASIDYTGPVQLQVTTTDDISTGWVQARVQ
ncbi:hypothetical protein QE374_001999 [Microbacterium sp. SORGH_AS428]|uniref:hypothetical protein n=1 Tax=Microbacterium sp. SORGH_AS_0428 TaxID=3041788 RepID=UPI00285D7EE7|nr:hypothetical protein [Microbacterium sp. SORGH_AS_0428]MDR6200090.1 hypothetical protein [Microbacterium sp. SORGH_AS_0428]